MDSVIRLLPDNIANQIAAGEVIQRPASVVKELVENAIDAGATDIVINIKDAGKTLIQVIDNGKGMAPMDARMAFERHATSKIRTADDLFALTTMGFRGEALPSISAVSHVTLQTRTADDAQGTKLHIEGSKLISSEPVMCSLGSNFCVRHLFFNVPARRKFLKQDSTEFQHILTEVRNIAAVRAEVAFTITHNDQVIIQLSPTALKQRIIDLFGSKLSSVLLPVDVETPLITIRGFVTRTSHTRKRGASQYFFTNERYMKHPFFHRMVMNAYGELIPRGEQPEYFLYLTGDPAGIDVNISPTKTEIKFEAESDIGSILFSSVKEVLMLGAAVPTLEFDIEDRIHIPVAKHISPEYLVEPPTHAPYVEIGSRMNIGEGNPNSSTGAIGQEGSFHDATATQAAQTPDLSDWDSFYEQFETNRKTQPSQHTILSSAISGADRVGSALFTHTDEVQPISTSDSPSLPIIFGEYAAYTDEKGMTIVHMSRARFHIMYSKLMSLYTQGQCVSSRLLFPSLLDLGLREQQLLQEYMPDLLSVGFDISDMGQGAFAVNAVPDGINAGTEEQVIITLLDECSATGKSGQEVLGERMVRHIAGYRVQQQTNPTLPNEAQQLIRDLITIPDHVVTVTGKTIISILTPREILKRFGA